MIDIHVKSMITEFVRWACSLCDLTYRPKGSCCETVCATLGNVRAAWLQNPDYQTSKKLCWLLFYLGEHHTKKMTGRTEAERAEGRILKLMNRRYIEEPTEELKAKGRKRSSFVQQIYTCTFNVSRCNVLRRASSQKERRIKESDQLYQKLQVTRPKEIMKQERADRKKETHFLQTIQGKSVKVSTWVDSESKPNINIVPRNFTGGLTDEFIA